jgi:hypothetical protein
MRNRIQWMTCMLVAAAVLAASMPLAASTSAFVTVTNRPEEALTWCGAATGQMIMSSYPTSSCAMVQADVWSGIQTYKMESTWDTDPVGLQEAMNHLCPPPGGHWALVEDTDATRVMYAAAFWMNFNHYAVAALLKTAPHNGVTSHREDWVTIKGIVTDLDPLTAPTVTLQYVLFVEQAPTFGGPPTERFATGTQWYSEFQTVSIAESVHNGKFVTVIEPPKRSGTAIIAKRLPATGKIITPDAAMAAASRALQNDLQQASPSFRTLATLQPARPLLVRGDRVSYYLVPLSGGDKSQASAVLINADSGAFMEAGRYGPRPMLSASDAIARALRVRRVPRTIGEPFATLVAPDDAGSPYFPSWLVYTGNDSWLVDPEGNVRWLRSNINPID